MYEQTKIKQVILLGAGASKSEGAPLQNELFREFFQYYRNMKDTFFLPKNDERIIVKFFKDFWGINISNYQLGDINFPTFEECLGILELASFRNESLKGCADGTIDETRNALIFLLAKVLDEKLKGKASHHKRLIERLKGEGMLKDTSFLSLNYDIIIDNVLVDLYPDFNIDYGIDFVNFDRVGDWEKPEGQKAILLLKMHGSLNWLYCPTCSHMELTPREKGAIQAFYRQKRCGDCETSMQPIIIPPTFYKEMSNPFIQQIFSKTDQILRHVDRVFICGYSFPDADIHVKYILKRAEQYTGITPDIYVINYHQGKTELQIEEEKRRFYRFFKDRDRVCYTNLSFEEFCRNGISCIRT